MEPATLHVSRHDASTSFCSLNLCNCREQKTCRIPRGGLDVCWHFTHHGDVRFVVIHGWVRTNGGKTKNAWDIQATRNSARWLYKRNGHSGWLNGSLLSVFLPHLKIAKLVQGSNKQLNTDHC